MVINKLSFFAIQFAVNEGCLLMGLVVTYRNECQYYVNECVSEWLMQTQSSSSTNTRRSTYLSYVIVYGIFDARCLCVGLLS